MHTHSHTHAHTFTHTHMHIHSHHHILIPPPPHTPTHPPTPTPTHTRLLLGGGKLIAIHKARYFESGDGLALGPGPFVSALEYASGREAEVVGKPEPTFFSSVLREMGCDATEVVMIGDVSTSIPSPGLALFQPGSETSPQFHHLQNSKWWYTYGMVTVMRATSMSSSQDVLNDIHGAQEVGMKGFLVRTGEQSD